MKPPSKSINASLRGQNNLSTSGPGPIERGKVKQGMSSGTWPGERQAGLQPPGARCDNSAAHFADVLGGLAK